MNDVSECECVCATEYISLIDFIWSVASRIKVSKKWSKRQICKRSLKKSKAEQFQWTYWKSVKLIMHRVAEVHVSRFTLGFFPQWWCGGGPVHGNGGWEQFPRRIHFDGRCNLIYIYTSRATQIQTMQIAFVALVSYADTRRDIASCMYLRFVRSICVQQSNERTTERNGDGVYR